MDKKKTQRINEVGRLLEDFSKIHLNDELTEYCYRLWNKIGRKRNYIIIGGKKEVWASAVIYAIARLNLCIRISKMEKRG